uniref:Putative voltage-gated shaker-like k+ channel subunit beta/kcnab n=1 Tax=Nyssomyia neivai TaxID=330878 RepID=A0A1L8E0Q3_9DIPT
MSASKLAACKNILLNSGHQIPLIGLGTYLITDPEVVHSALDYALGAGYRHIDTATCYKNELQLGNALKELLPKYNLARDDIFITSKLIPDPKYEEYVLDIVETSVRKLQVDYIDLYLVHWPAAKGVSMHSPENSKFRDITWKGLVGAQKKGLLRSIGVSNYLERHLDELLANSYGIPPAVNQVEWHPHHYSPELLEYCEKKGIFLQAYSSFGGGSGFLTEDPFVKDIAKKLGKKESQVLLCWATQKNIGVIPKARSKQHIVDNLALDFDIPEEDMKILDNMEHREKYSWNPEPIN